MTGPEHYLAAEEILQSAQDADGVDGAADIATLLQFAQVHATLALAAATALQTPGGEDAGMYVADAAAWELAASAEHREDGEPS